MTRVTNITVKWVASVLYLVSPRFTSCVHFCGFPQPLQEIIGFCSVIGHNHFFRHHSKFIACIPLDIWHYMTMRLWKGCEITNRYLSMPNYIPIKKFLSAGIWCEKLCLKFVKSILNMVAWIMLSNCHVIDLDHGRCS